MAGRVQAWVRLLSRTAAIPEVITDFCRRRRITGLPLFRPVARDDFECGSDNDPLVGFEASAAPGIEFVCPKSSWTVLLTDPLTF